MLYIYIDWNIYVINFISIYAEFYNFSIFSLECCDMVVWHCKIIDCVRILDMCLLYNAVQAQKRGKRPAKQDGEPRMNIDLPRYPEE